MDETARKILHIVFGTGIAVFIFFCEKDLSVVILSFVLLTGFILSDALSRGYEIPLISTIVEAVERPGAFPGQGAILFFVSSLVCLVIFPVSVVVPAILALAVADGVSTIAGLRFGRTRIHNGKSVEGACAGCMATAIVLFLVLAPVPAIIAAAVASMTEVLCPVDDNLIIPVVVCVVLTLLGLPV
jgi:dolichol kinase